MRTLILFLLTSCVTPTGGPKSSWRELQNAKKMKCREAYTTERDLSPLDLKILKARPPLILTKTKLRNGRTTFYLRPGEFGADAEDVKRIEWGDQGTLIAGEILVHNKRRVVLVQTNSAAETSNIVLYDPLNANVKFRAPTMKGEFDSAEVAPSGDGKGFFILLRSHDASVLRLLKHGSSPLHFQIVEPAAANLPAGAKLLYDSENDYLIALWQRGSAFEYRIVAKTGLVGETRVIPPIGDPPAVFSNTMWDAVQNGKYLDLVATVGDGFSSGTTLYFARFEIKDKSPVLVFAKKFPIPDAYLSQPIIRQHPTKDTFSEIAFSKWLDEESTMIVGELSTKSGQLDRPMGILPKGARIVDSLQTGQNKMLYVIRNRAGANAQLSYQLCETEIH